MPDSRIIADIVFKGTLKDKEQYKRAYLLEPGEFFDKTVHEKSLDGIRALLAQNGYLAGDVTASCICRRKTKKVALVLKIDAGERFVINGFDVRFIRFPSGDFSSADRQALENACRAVLVHVFSCTPYSEKKQVDSCLTMLKEACNKKGFFNIGFAPESIIDKQKKTVRLIVDLDFDKAERYLFSGNAFFDDARLFKHIAPFNVPLCVTSPEAVGDDIMQSYKDDGFLECTVALHKEKRTYRFVIHEGIRFKIVRVDIRGMCQAPETVHDACMPLTHAAYYSAALMRFCFDDLRERYVARGFWDFAIDEYVFSAGPHPDEKTVILCVHEGAQKLLRRVTVERFHAVMQEKPFCAYRDAEMSIPFDKKIMQEQQDFLDRYAREKGYLYGAFEYRCDPVSPGSNIVDLNWKMTGLDVPVTFGKTVVAGNSRIAPARLVKGLAYNEGDVWNTHVLDKSLDRLKGLAVFKSVSLKPADFFMPEPSKKMILTVIEDEPYELSLHAGLGFLSKNFDARGNGVTYRLGCGFLCKNPAHCGDLMRIDGDFTRYTQCGELAYTVPFWTSAPTALQTRVFCERRDQPFFIGSPDILYTFLKTGGSSRFSGSYDYIDWNVKSNVEWLKIEGLSPYGARVLQFEPALLDAFFPYFTVEPHFSFNYVDDPIKTHKGLSTSVVIKGMFPFTLKSAWMVKTIIEQSFFYPVFSEVICALRIRLGTIFNADFERIMPPERFYLGGADSLRGYSTDFAPPLNRYVDRSGIEHWVPVGGKSSVNVNGEVRFPLYGNLGGVLFTDIGFLSQHGITRIMSEKLLGSSGAGLRYTTPVGILRFDIGLKWEKYFVEDRSYAWFLSLGNVF